MIQFAQFKLWLNAVWLSTDCATGTTTFPCSILAGDSRSFLHSFWLQQRACPHYTVIVGRQERGSKWKAKSIARPIDGWANAVDRMLELDWYRKRYPLERARACELPEFVVLVLHYSWVTVPRSSNTTDFPLHAWYHQLSPRKFLLILRWIISFYNVTPSTQTNFFFEFQWVLCLFLILFVSLLYLQSCSGMYRKSISSHVYFKA